MKGKSHEELVVDAVKQKAWLISNLKSQMTAIEEVVAVTENITEATVLQEMFDGFISNVIRTQGNGVEMPKDLLSRIQNVNQWFVEMNTENGAEVFHSRNIGNITEPVYTGVPEAMETPTPAPVAAGGSGNGSSPGTYPGGGGTVYVPLPSGGGATGGDFAELSGDSSGWCSCFSGGGSTE